MRNRRLHKIERFHMPTTPESERLKVTALNLFHPTTSPLVGKTTLTLCHQRLCHDWRKNTSFARWSRRLGDEVSERKPFIAHLRCSKPMKRISFLKKPITRNFKRSHSKAEEPNCLLLRNLPSSSLRHSLSRGRGAMI